MSPAPAHTEFHLLRRLIGEARPYRVHIAAIFAVSMLSAPLTLLTPVPLQIAVDSVINSHPLPGFLDGIVPSAVSDSKDAILVLAAVMFLVIAVLTQLQDLGATVLKTFTGEKLVLNFRGKLFHQSQRLSLAYHDQVGTSDSTYRVQEDAKSLQYILVESLISLITAATTLAAMIYVTARIDLQLALVALAVSPLLLVAAKYFRPRMRATSREVKQLESGALSVVQEVLTGLRVVKAFGQEGREQERFVAQSSLGMRARIRLRLIEGGYAVLVGALIGGGSSVVLFVGIRHVQQGIITLGELLLVMGYLSQLYAPIRTMARKAGSLQSHLASSERAFALLEQAPEVPERPHAQPLPRAAGAVEFRRVSFGYGPDRVVLENISFGVEPGMSVGVRGATGAGKTTLINLLTRFYDPLAGQILLDGVDLRDYKLADLRNQFGIVLQEPVLFSTSIAENIAYARSTAARREIEAAAAAANIHDFILSLPQGYDTPVGERGMGLSGGERQRISLARAFLKDARILILDEPTSSVDLGTEALILEAMNRLMAGRTSFMVAHRLSTLDACDLQLDMESGRIATVSSTSSPARTRLPTSQAPYPGRRPRRSLTGVSPTKSVLVAPAEVSDHPAVRAWRSLAGSRPRHVHVVKQGRRFRKSAIYLLDGAGPDGSPVIAKLSGRKTAEIESAMYRELLPRLPTPSLRCYGTVPDSDTDRRWLFLEHAGSEPYSPANPEHRRLSARWLAGVRLRGAEILADADLPDRGPRHYLVHLLQAREEIERQLRRHRPGADGTPVLQDLISMLDAIESRWNELAASCRALPQTLVHGDLVPKNLRVTHNGGGMGLAVFDWETAGFGVQSPDLAQLLEPERSAVANRQPSKRFDRFSANPCLDTYRSVLADSATGLEAERVDRSAAVGNLFRCVAGINWTCSQASSTWFPLEDLRVYSGWLRGAMPVVGWSSSGRSTLAQAGHGAGEHGTTPLVARGAT